MTEDLSRKLVVEAIGAFALAFIGCGAIVMTQGDNLVAIALAHGLAIGLMVTALGHISGGHYNPAVTLGMLVARRIDITSAIGYVIAQLVGAVLGAGALTLIYRDVDRNRVELGLPVIGQSTFTEPAQRYSSGNAFVAEAILTFFLVLVVFGVAVDHRTGGRAIAGLAIGLTITMDIFAGGAVSGAAVNPSRWFGPAVIQQEFGDFWIWIAGPALGGVVAALLFSEFLLGRGLFSIEAAEATPAAPATERVAVAAPRRRQSRRK